MSNFIRKSAVLCAALAVVFSLTGCMPEKRSGAEHYNKSYYISRYGGDLNSNLSVFPDEVADERVILFESSMLVGLFDTDGYIILEYRCDAEQIAAEEERLKALSMTISHYDGQTFTNYVMYDEKSYKYPAYITNDGFGTTYEYALIDRAGGRIIYVYSAYVMPDGFQYKDYLKKDLSEYNKNKMKAFTMYNHTFDGGRSYDEFDDLTVSQGDK